MKNKDLNPNYTSLRCPDPELYNAVQDLIRIALQADPYKRRVSDISSVRYAARVVISLTRVITEESERRKQLHVYLERAVMLPDQTYEEFLSELEERLP